MGCLKLDYYEDLQVRTCIPMLSHEAKMVLCWLSVDVMAGKHSNIGAYTYCANNPINLVDPDGNDWFVNDQGFFIWANSSSVRGFSYAGNVLPGNIDHYQILEEKNGRLFHKNTDDWVNRNINNYLGTNLDEKKPYDHAEESFFAETKMMALGMGIAKLGGWALGALGRAGGSLWNVEGGWLARGFIYEEMLGGNLVKNYPVIDKFVQGVATSIKTLDLGAKTYQNAGKVLSVLKGYINKLEAFEGANFAKVNTTNGAITEKILEVGIPKGASAAQIEAIQSAVKYGAENGIKVNVRVVN
jgi:hypothetical protein